MEKLLICEGKNDREFLYYFLKRYFKKEEIGRITYNRKADNGNHFIYKNLPKEKIVIVQCGGLNGIKDFWESLIESPKIYYIHKVLKKIVWDEDPDNEQSEKTKNGIRLCLNECNHHKEPITIENMLEDLVIRYLDGHEKYKELQKPLKCMRDYIRCLAATEEKIHGKVRLEILKYGIFLQKYKGKPELKDLPREDKIIPNIFAEIDFEHQTFNKLREKLRKFIEVSIDFNK